MRTFTLLLASLALGCASSSGVSSLHDGTAPGSPFQLVGAGVPDKEGMERIFGSIDFLVLLSNVSHEEQYLDSISVSPAAPNVYDFETGTKKIDRMIEENEDLEIEVFLRLKSIQSPTRDRSRPVPIRVVASMRDRTGYVWTVEVPGWNLP